MAYHSQNRLAPNFLRFFPVLSPVLFIAVFVALGQVQPGYDPLRFTVSRLAIGEYGWVQNLNFLQLAFSLLILSGQLSRRAPNPKTKQAYRTALGLSAATLVLAAVFPTDPSETRVSLENFTPNGALHVATVGIFIILSPYIFRNLARAFGATPGLEKLEKLTLFMFRITLAGCLAWLVYYPFGLTRGYLGIFQKTIIVWVLVWVEIVNYRIFLSR